MVRQLRRSAPPEPAVTRIELAQAVELFEEEVDGIVARELARQLHDLFAALLAVGPGVADQLAAETDPQRIAAVVTGQILSIMERYQVALRVNVAG